MPKRARVVVLVLILAAVGYGVFRSTVGKPEEGPLTASGTIEAVELDLSPRISGRIVQLAVDEGAVVSKGQLVAVLSAPEVGARVEQAKGALANAQARLADLEKGTRQEQIESARARYEAARKSAEGNMAVYGTVAKAYAQSIELKANVATAEANVKSATDAQRAAQQQYELVKAGPRAEDIRLAKAAVDQAQAQYEAAQKDFQRVQELYSQGAVAKQQLDNATAARDAARAAVGQAQARLDAASAGSRPEEIRQAKARADQAGAQAAAAQTALRTARQIYRTKYEALQRLQAARTASNTAGAQAAAARSDLDLLIAGPTQDQIAAARAQVEQAKGALAEAQSNNSQIRVYAPMNGVVTVKYREIGEVVGASTPIVRIADLDRVWLRVYAPMTSIGGIKLGSQVEITTQAEENRTYSGRVASIKDEPEFTPKNVQTAEERVKLVYAVRIDIENKSHELKPGLPADATFPNTSAPAER